MGVINGMAQIYITYAGVSSANKTLRKAVHELAQMEEKYAFLFGAVDSEIQSRYQIREQLRICHQTAEKIHQTVDDIFNVAETGLLEYRMTEARLKRSAPSDDEIFEMR